MKTIRPPLTLGKLREYTKDLSDDLPIRMLANGHGMKDGVPVTGCFSTATSVEKDGVHEVTPKDVLLVELCHEPA